MTTVKTDLRNTSRGEGPLHRLPQVRAGEDLALVEAPRLLISSERLWWRQHVETLRPQASWLRRRFVSGSAASQHVPAPTRKHGSCRMVAGARVAPKRARGPRGDVEVYRGPGRGWIATRVAGSGAG